jgi:hypothetical protein
LPVTSDSLLGGRSRVVKVNVAHRLSIVRAAL